jgi:hypothetical protein
VESNLLSNSVRYIADGLKCLTAPTHSTAFLHWASSSPFPHLCCPTSYSTLCALCSSCVGRVLSTVSLNVSFRRFLNDNNRILWNDLVGRIMQIRLNNPNDVFSWNLHQHGQYTVHSLHLALINNGMANNMNKQLWRLKIPLKIKIFMWYMWKEVVLTTKDNLLKPN